MDLNPNCRYLITGASGFLGESLIRRLESKRCKNIVTVSRNEGKLIELKQKFPHIECIPGDIASEHTVWKSMQKVDACFHLAAFKHVGLAETHVKECVSSNVTGTQNILDIGCEMGLHFILGISTDKAAQVAGTYGASKLLMERLFEEYDALYPTKCRIVRYGNVLYSTGSVLCKWKDLLQQGKQVVVTDTDATRFFWTREQAIDLILDCLEHSVDSSPYVPEMKAMRIGDLLEAMSRKYLKKGSKLDLKIIGLQQGENMHEKILEDGPTSAEVERYTVDEIVEMV